MKRGGSTTTEAANGLSAAMETDLESELLTKTDFARHARGSKFDPQTSSRIWTALYCSWCTCHCLDIDSDKQRQWADVDSRLPKREAGSTAPCPSLGPRARPPFVVDKQLAPPRRGAVEQEPDLLSLRGTHVMGQNHETPALKCDSISALDRLGFLYGRKLNCAQLLEGGISGSSSTSA